MSMLWVGVGTAAVGLASSVYGANKQAGAAKNAANLSQQQYASNVAMEQPFINSGYGALGKLNTLLGLNPNPNANAMRPGGGGTSMIPNTGQMYRPTPGGGVQQLLTNNPGSGGMPYGPMTPKMGGMPPQQQPQQGGGGMPPLGNFNLQQILSLRAMHGDTQAASILQRMAA